MKPFAIAATLALTLTLAACGNSSEQPAETAAPAAEAAPVEAAPIEAAPVEAAPEATAADTIEVSPEAAMQAIQQNVEQLNLTEAEKLDAVAKARTEAEAASRAAGLNDAQVKQAGDAAEQAARTMFGL
jgi:hypothetical protein